MITTGQLIMGKPLSRWEWLSPEGAGRLEDAGVTQIAPVCGLLEVPLFETGLPSSGLYAFSVESSLISSLSRFMVRMEADGDDPLNRLIRSPENAAALSVRLGPSGRAASRAGWGSFTFAGYATQSDEPSLFPGIFYEMLLDQAGETLLIAPNAASRHYAHGDLADIGVPDVRGLPIWGYEETPFRLSPAEEVQDEHH